MLQILLLGTPIIQHRGAPLRIQRRLLRSILYYLAAQEKPISRDEMISTFWPDLPIKRSRERLRDALSKLRAQLPDASILMVDHEYVQLDGIRVSVDVRIFEKKARELQFTASLFHPDKPLPERLYQQMAETVDLWRSPEFLAGASLPEGDDYSKWTLEKEHLLEDLQLDLLNRLAKHSKLSGDLEQSIRWCQAALLINPWNDHYHLEIIKAMLNLGQNESAVAYSDYVMNLYQNENTEFWTELYDVCQNARASKTHHGTMNRSPWPYPFSLNVPFAGRAEEMRSLKLAYYQGGVAVIEGESGSGKTRLVYELYHSLNPAPRLITTTARSLEQGLPYQPCIDMMRSSISDMEWKSLKPSTLSILAYFIPFLEGYLPKSYSHLDMPVAVNQSMLFESFREALGLISRNERLFVFLDDAQWCDAGTLEAFSYLAERRFFADLGLLVLAYRTEETNPTLEKLIRSLSRTQLVKTIQLNRLADDDISTLVYHFFRKIPTHEELRIFDQRTGGNPLLVLETLHAALSQSPGIDLAKAIRSLPNAGNVYGLIQTRLEKLPPSARNLITLAAMIGREFRLDILAETLSPSDCPNMIADLEILEQNNLILPLTRVSSPAYVFIHEQFRESMLLNLSQARKQALHLVVASAIKKVDDSHHMASQLAIHLESAGKLSMAFESWLIAARYAFKLKSPREADICLKRAQNISHQLKLKLPDSAVYELYQLWSELALSESNLQTIVEISDNLQKDGSLRQSNLLLGTGLSLQAQGLLLKGQYTTSQMVLQQSIPHLQYCGNPFELSLAHLRKGQASLYSKKIQDAIIDLEKAIGSSQQGDDLPFLAIRAKAQYHLAVAHNMQGWPRLSLELGQQALENSLKGFDPATELMARATICHALLYMGQYQEAVIEAEKGLMLAEDRSNLLAAGYLYLALGRSELIMGHLDRGWDYSQTAIKLGLENEYQEVYSEACCITGDIFRILDSPLDAIKMYRLGIKGEISYFTNMDNQYRLGLLLGIGGNLEIGLELIQETLDQAKLEGIGTVSIPAEISRAYVIMVNQKDSDADQSINEVAYDLAKRGLVTMPIFPQTITAIKAIRNGDFNTAVEAAQQLIKTGEKHNSPIIRMRGLQILDQVWMASGMSVYKSQKQLLEVYNYLASQTTNPQIRPLVLARRHEVLSGK